MFYKPNQTKPRFGLGRIFVAVILGLLVASCIEEENDQISESLNPEIQSAKAWYEQVETSGGGSENARKVKNGKGKPDWAKSKIYHQKDGKKVIEVQFDFEEIAIPEHLKTEKLEKKFGSSDFDPISKTGWELRSLFLEYLPGQS